MVNKRYRAELKSLLGNEYYIDVRPINVQANPRTMRLSSEGFQLEYAGAGTDFREPIKGSRVSIIMHVQNAEDEEYVNDIASEQDQTYVIEILKKQPNNTYLNWWTGYIWPEDVQISHAGYPFTAKLTATDSAARFKEYKGYPYNPVRVWEIFQMVFSNYSPQGALTQDGNIVLNGAATGNYQKLRLALSVTHNYMGQGEKNIWYNFSKSGSEAYPYNINTEHNRLEVIKQWLKMWGCRVFLEEGYYKIAEFRYHTTGTMTYAEHDNSGVPTGATYTEPLTIYAGNEHKILEGGKFFFKQPFRRAHLEYINSILSSATKATDINVFSIDGANSRNAKQIDESFGDIWSYKLGYTTTGNDPVIDVTSWLYTPYTTGRQSLVSIFQTNLEWFFKLPQRYFTGTIRSKTFKFSNLLIIGKEKYLTNSVTLTAATDEWQGEWVKVGELADNPWLSQNTDTQMDSQSLADKINFQS